MLVLSRKVNETICLGDDITLKVVRIKGNTIQLGIDAPSNVKILRGELVAKQTSKVPNRVADTSQSQHALSDIAVTERAADEIQSDRMQPESASAVLDVADLPRLRVVRADREEFAEAV